MESQIQVGRQLSQILKQGFLFTLCNCFSVSEKVLLVDGQMGEDGQKIQIYNYKINVTVSNTVLHI